MNKIYRVVWNTELGQWVVASEVAKGRKKKSTRHAGLAVAVTAVVSVAATVPVHAAGIANDLCAAPANAGSGTWSNVVGCWADAGAYNSSHNLGESLFGSYGVISRDVSFASTFGFGSQIQAYYGSGFGASTFVGVGATNSVALGTGSVATEANTVSLGRTGSNPMAGTWAAKGGDGSGQDSGGLDANLSGALTRRLTNMSAGIAGTDAVNVNQLKGVTTALGGGAAVNADGSIRAPTYTVQGSTANDVGTALGKLDTAVNNINNGGIKYFHVNSGAADSQATGGESIAIGGGAKAVGAASVALGNNAQNVTGANNSIAIGGDAKSSDKSVTIGNGADTSTQAWSTAVGTNAKVTGALGTAVGEAAQVTGSNAAAIGSHSIADRANAVSVGSSSLQRQIIQVAKGTADTDAVNLSQLKAAGVTVDPNGVPTNAFVAYDTTTKDKITLAGTGGTTITNLKDGAVAAGSKDAVTGGQLYTAINNGAGIKYFHANSTGTGVDNDGAINTTDDGTTTINGDSTSGTGIDNGGVIDTSGSGKADMNGTSTDGTGINNDGTIHAGDDSEIEATGTSTKGAGIIDTGSIVADANAKVVLDNNGTVKVLPDNSGNGGGGNNNGGDNGGVTPAPRTRSHGGGAGGAIGAIGLGAAGWMLAHHDAAHWYLERAERLTVESGDPQVWAGAELEQVSVDLDQGSADVQLLTKKGAVKRHLAYRDGADGVKHFTSDDAGVQSDLSVNVKTNEFFYTERGTIDGKPYVVKAHGWLKPGQMSASAK